MTPAQISEIQRIRSMDPDDLPDGIPCSHRGCLNHLTHPCEGCGRVGGKKNNLNNFLKGCKFVPAENDRPEVLE